MGESAAPIRGTPAKAFAPGQATILSTATLIVAAREGRRGVLVINHGTLDVFIGNSNVTVGSGLLLAGTKGVGIMIPVDTDLYGIVAAGSQVVSFSELYGK